MTATLSTTPAHPAPTSLSSAHPIVYPESDGKPMADNTRQFRYIVTIQGGIAALFADRPDVFVAGDLLCLQQGLQQALDRLLASGMSEAQARCLLGLG